MKVIKVIKVTKVTKVIFSNHPQFHDTNIPYFHFSLIVR